MTYYDVAYDAREEEEHLYVFSYKESDLSSTSQSTRSGNKMRVMYLRGEITNVIYDAFGNSRLIKVNGEFNVKRRSLEEAQRYAVYILFEEFFR
jgi:hypothetical protein